MFLKVHYYHDKCKIVIKNPEKGVSYVVSHLTLIGVSGQMVVDPTKEENPRCWLEFRDVQMHFNEEKDQVLIERETGDPSAVVACCSD